MSFNNKELFPYSNLSNNENQINKKRAITLNIQIFRIRNQYLKNGALNHASGHYNVFTAYSV